MTSLRYGLIIHSGCKQAIGYVAMAVGGAVGKCGCPSLTWRWDVDRLTWILEDRSGDAE